MSDAIKVLTFGCRLNTVESEGMRRAAEAAGLSGAVLVNTCAVTGDAVRQARQQIRRARRENPNARIIVTGCAAQIEPQTFAAMDEVDLVLGNDLKTRVESYRMPSFAIGEAEKRVRVNDIMSVRETAPQMLETIDGHARAFIEVQNGCDHRCTFCVIPYGRGNSRSVPMGAVVDQAKRLADNGYRELVLTGVDATSYGADLPGSPKLGDLCAAILKHVPDIQRLRLSSIDSIEADPLLLDLAKSEPRFMPHLHLSLQHGDNLILKRMKRRHTREDAIRLVSDLKAHRPDFAFGADIIAGFPTETGEAFQHSLDLVEECGIAFLHVFPYSPRPGTPAARMPQLERSLIKERAARLRDAGNRVYQAHLSSMVACGKGHQVLTEYSGLGRTENFTPVFLPEAPRAALVDVDIIGHDGSQLTGRVVGEPVPAAPERPRLQGAC